MNHKAWDGLRIVIYARTPGKAMNFEQELAGALPNLEAQIDSYENYEDALDFCKDTKNAAFFLCFEDQRSPAMEEIFRNLVKPYESSGWPGFAVLIHEGVETIAGLKTVSKNKKFIGYKSIHDFSTHEGIIESFSEFWNDFSQMTSTTFVSQDLENTLMSMSAQYLPSGNLLFHNQALTLLSANLAISWKDALVLKWYPTIRVLKDKLPEILSNHDTFSKIVLGSAPTQTTSSSIVERLNDQNIPLQMRFLELLCEMNRQRNLGTLEGFLNEMSKFGVPGGPAIFRHLSKRRDEILRLSTRAAAA